MKATPIITMTQGASDGTVDLTQQDVQTLLESTPTYASWEAVELNTGGALLRSKLDERTSFLNLPVSEIQKLYADTQENTIKVQG